MSRRPARFRALPDFLAPADFRALPDFRAPVAFAPGALRLPADFRVPWLGVRARLRDFVPLLLALAAELVRLLLADVPFALLPLRLAVAPLCRPLELARPPEALRPFERLRPFDAVRVAPEPDFASEVVERAFALVLALPVWPLSWAIALLLVHVSATRPAKGYTQPVPPGLN